ncbi:MAG: ribosome maturation factor RimM [Rickettsiales bacterium]|nr:ribosome maturation factor RimM [Rickettsiales bacterium]
MNQENEKYIIAGKVASPHGIRGAVKIFSYLEKPENFSNFKNFYDKNGGKISLKILSVHKNLAIAEINNSKTREEAEKLKNFEIFIKRKDLPNLDKNFYYYEDLKNLSVKSSVNENIGVISDVINFGSNDILEITYNDGKKELFAFTKKTFPEINIKDRFIIINPPEVDFDK